MVVGLEVQVLFDVMLGTIFDSSGRIGLIVVAQLDLKMK